MDCTSFYWKICRCGEDDNKPNNWWGEKDIQCWYYTLKGGQSKENINGMFVGDGQCQYSLLFDYVIELTRFNV